MELLEHHLLHKQLLKEAALQRFTPALLTQYFPVLLLVQESEPEEPADEPVQELNIEEEVAEPLQKDIFEDEDPFDDDDGQEDYDEIFRLLDEMGTDD